ncbi:MAG TPA: response regulator transcription factor [Rhizomicrobium sp.]|nr:response regulator transcription factor [Rhizomicrobium sp.]
MSILLVEDEEALAGYLKSELGNCGHVVEHVARGDLAYEAATHGGNYDLLVVDRMLPGLDGLSLIQRLRKENTKTPVLFLSNLGGLDDRVEGLNAGADDYLAKPFAFSELLARVNALLRRPPGINEPQLLRLGEFELDRIKRKLTRAGVPILLQPREMGLLEYLLLRRGQIVTRTMLLEGVWGYHFDPKTHIVETHMSRLRAKLGEDIIQTIRGSGYIIRAPQPDA